MHVRGDPSLPFEPQDLPPEGSSAPPAPPEQIPTPPIARAKRDSRPERPQREILRRTSEADKIPFSKHAALEPRRDMRAKMLEELALSRDAIPLSNKKELLTASLVFREKASELASAAVQLLQESGGTEPKLQQGLALLREALLYDKYEELDEPLFKLLTKAPEVESLIVKTLQEWIKKSVEKSESKTILRSDTDWEQKLLRVMHNGYLSGLFATLDKEVLAMRSAKYIDKSGELVKVSEAGVEAYRCIDRVRGFIDRMPPKLILLYGTLYENVRQKYGDEAFADLQLAQFLFLRGVNAFIAKPSQIDRYRKVEEKELEKEGRKSAQCVLISKIIQTAIGRIKILGEEKEDKKMVVPDPTTRATLLDIIRTEGNHQMVLALVRELKTKLK